MRYYVEYDLRDVNDEWSVPYSPWADPQCAMVFLKEIDGKEYWTLEEIETMGWDAFVRETGGQTWS